VQNDGELLKMFEHRLLYASTGVSWACDPICRILFSCFTWSIYSIKCQIQKQCRIWREIST